MFLSKKSCFYLLLLGTWPQLASAQYFQVDTLRYETPGNTTNFYSADANRFPILVSEKHWKVSEYINQYLHADFLHIMPRTKGNPFEAVVASPGEMEGTSAIDFYVNNNSARVFSVTVSADYTSAYTERFSIRYNFNAQTGEYITLHDLFTPETLLELQPEIAEMRVTEVKQLLLETDTAVEDGREKYKLFSECIPYLQQSSLTYESFLVTDSTITFVHERCSNHALMALDDMGEFYTTLPLKAFLNKLTPFGRELLVGKASKAKSNPVYPAMKLLKGKIGKNLNVTFIMGRKYDYSPDVSGMYYYDSFGNMIELSATITNDQWSIIEYSGPNVRNAQMEGTYKNGLFTGRWSHQSDGRKLPVVLKLVR